MCSAIHSISCHLTGCLAYRLCQDLPVHLSLMEIFFFLCFFVPKLFPFFPFSLQFSGSDPNQSAALKVWQILCKPFCSFPLTALFQSLAIAQKRVSISACHFLKSTSHTSQVPHPLLPQKLWKLLLNSSSTCCASMVLPLNQPISCTLIIYAMVPFSLQSSTGVFTLLYLSSEPGICDSVDKALSNVCGPLTTRGSVRGLGM